MTSRKLEDIFKKDGTGRLQDIYADFTSSEDIAISQFQKESTAFTDTNFKTLIDLLFPRQQSGFYSGDELWKRIKELTNSADDVQKDTLTKFFAKKIRMYYYSGYEGVSSAEGEIFDFYKKNRPSAYNAFVEKEYKEVSTGLRGLLNASKNPTERVETKLKSSLTMILVDTPSIDLKLRNSDIVSTFINYMPGIMASQLVPYLDVKFSFERKGSTADENNRPQSTMSPLKFLMGAEPITPPSSDGSVSATALIYDTYTTNVVKRGLTLDKDAFKKQIERLYSFRKPGQPAKQFPEVKDIKVEQTSSSTQTTTTGMEMFCMPQTLINMDYDQETVPRYNPVLNATLPFGTIQSFNVNVTSAGHGVISYKTATLTLKIFDRSRLVEIADFLNPKLYGQALLWITYGWRAPSQPIGGEDRNSYLAMINEHMLKKEAYGIVNSSISIGDDGTASVTLSLAMKFAQELSRITPNVGSEVFNAEQQDLETKMINVKKLAEKLGLGGSGAADIRGSTIINAALGGSFPTGDAKTIKSEFGVIERALEKNTSPDAQEFLKSAKALYAIADSASKSSATSRLEGAANVVATNRFDVLKKGKDYDMWSIISSAGEANKFKSDDDPQVVHPLTNMHKLLSERKITKAGGKIVDSFGDVSFARLFATYFSSAATTIGGEDAPIDEYQVIFYNFNELAGTVASVNIGEFPIDIDSLQNLYAEKVVKQKGENMTLLNFLEIVRESQFGNQRHKAYGFSDLYDEKGNLKTDHTDELLKRQIQNQGLGSSFVLPAIDFYVETSNYSSNNAVQDLLTTFEVGSVISSKGIKPDGYKKIVRIHIYDKASIPHKAAYDILTNDGAYVEVDTKWQQTYRAKQQELIKKINEIKDQKIKKDALEDFEKTVKEQTSSDQIKIEKDQVTIAGISATARSISFADKNGKARFDLVKREISRFTPTITVGTNGTTIKSVNYGSEQDAKISTIMMLRNRSETQNPSLPNGSAPGDLPLRVIPGSLSITTMGCPLFDYMQQFFIDLGTGTTIDNLYNITNLSHTLTPGSFTSDIKFTFADAYGKYESPQNYATQMSALAQRIANRAKESETIQKRNGPPTKPAAPKK